jgi:hypothetical protein
MILSVVIFASGAAVGWALAAWLPPRPRGLPPGLQPDPPVDQLVAQMTDELLLTDEQARQITTIYQARFAALKSVRDEMRPRFTKEYDQLRADVQKVLTPAQFDRWNRRFESARSRMMPPPPRPPRPPPPPQPDRGPPPPDGGPDDRGPRPGPPDRRGPPDGMPPGPGPDGRPPPPPPDGF